MGRRSWGHDVSELARAEKLNGEVVGAVLLDANDYRCEGTLADGDRVERWRLTDDLDALLLADAEFVPGGDYDEVRAALERRYPSAVPGASRIEIWAEDPVDRDLLVHALSLADTLVCPRERNPSWKPGDNYTPRYRSTWVEDPVAVLEDVCSRHGDLVVTAELEQELRGKPGFDSSALVIGRPTSGYDGKPTSYYGIVKYNPGKARARQKARETIRRKEQHAADLSSYARTLTNRANAAFGALRDELTRDHGIDAALAEYKGHYNGDDCTRKHAIARLKALLVVHRALQGKAAYRQNKDFQAFLEAYRGRPEGLYDGDWGNYDWDTEKERNWVAVEAARPMPKAVRLRLDAEEDERRQEDLRLRTCTACGAVKDDTSEVSLPPYGAGMPRETRLCHECYERKEAELAAAAEAQEVDAAG